MLVPASHGMALSSLAEAVPSAPEAARGLKDSDDHGLTTQRMMATLVYFPDFSRLSPKTSTLKRFPRPWTLEVGKSGKM
jgi:hypothetical protein